MKEVILKIDGMKCGMCEAHINNAIRRLDGIKKVSSSHKTGLVKVIILNESIEDIKYSIEKEGYKILDIKINDYKKKGLFKRFFK